VLNAGFPPFSSYLFSLRSGRDTIEAVRLDRVNIVSQYDTAIPNSPFEMRLPSAVSPKDHVKPARHLSGPGGGTKVPVWQVDRCR
jgi:hypothetical protein